MTNLRPSSVTRRRGSISNLVLPAAVLFVAILGPSRSFASDTLYPHTLTGVPGVEAFLWPAGITVIRTEEEWRRFWGSYTVELQLPPPPRPSVDFTKDMVIAISLGQAPSGYQMQIVEYSRSQRSVLYELSTPRPGVPVPQVVSRLADMVIVPRIEGHLNFRLMHVPGEGRVRLPQDYLPKK
jgi:hypothetical protein